MDRWDKRYLELARFVAGWSKDPSTQVGAVVVDWKNRVVSLGFNGFPRGVADAKPRLENRDVKYRLVRHAEANAMDFSQRAIDGCTLYTWPLMPCSQCAGQAIQRGISRVVSVENDNPRWREDLELSASILQEAGVDVILYSFEGEPAWRLDV